MDRPRRRAQSGDRPQVTTYYRSGGASTGNDSPFERKINKASPFKRIWIKTIDIVLVLILIFLLIHSLIIKSKAKVIADDTSYHSLSNYTDSTNHYLRSLRNSNKISFDENGLIKALETDYPEITAASVELPVFSENPIIRLNIAKPSYFLKSGNNEYLVDANGRIVAYKKQYPLVAGLPEIIDNSGFGAAKGKQVLSGADIDFLNVIVSKTKANGLKISALTLPPSAQEVDLKTTDKDYYVKFNFGGDPNVQVGQFLAARHEFAQKNTQPAEYLDVRVAGKIFYK